MAHKLIYFKPSNQMSFKMFAEFYELVLEVNVRDNLDKMHDKYYFVKFTGYVLREGCLVRGVHGNGRTIKAAINDYMRQISGRILEEYRTKREIRVPKLTAVGKIKGV